MELASTTCTSAAVVVTAVFMGLEIAASRPRALAVKMQPSLPQIRDRDPGDEGAELFSDTYYCFSTC